VQSRQKRLNSRILWGIAIAAFLLRLIVSTQLTYADGGMNPVLHPSPLTDLNTYRELAQSILEGNFKGPFYYQPFYYSVFLVAVTAPGYWLGMGLEFCVWSIIIAQSILSALTVLLAGRIAERLMGRAAAFTAAGLCAISAALIFYTPYCMIVTLQTFWITLSCELALRLLQQKRLKEAAFLGCALGCGILTRGNLYIILGGLTILLLCALPKRKKRLALAVPCFALLMQLPFAAINTCVTGKLCGASTASSAVLALGNTPEAPPGFLEYPPAYEDFMQRERAGEASVPVQILRWMKAEPLAFSELTFRKLLLFLDQFEIFNNVSFYYNGLRGSPILRLDLLGQSGVILALGLAGMFLFLGKIFRNRSAKWGVLYAFVLLYWGSIAMFYILSRFRAPILPLFAVFGALFAVRFIRTLRCRKSALLFCVAALLAGYFFVYAANPLYRDYLEMRVMRIARPNGVTVERMDGNTMKLDFGPYSCSHYAMFPLGDSAQIGKVFAQMPSGAVQGSIKILLNAVVPGTGEVLIGGKRIRFAIMPGMRTYDFPAEVLHGVLIIHFLQLPPGCYIIGDLQRNYARSSMNGRIFPCEWCIRLTFFSGKRK